MIAGWNDLDKENAVAAEKPNYAEELPNKREKVDR
jgi:hypothetical protein